MRRAYALACFLLFVLALAHIATHACAEPFGGAAPFDDALAASVTGTALAFMAPRTLDAVPIPRMALWGLRGLTTQDPRFTIDFSEGSARLLADSRPILVRGIPPPDDASAWGAVVAQVSRAAWDASGTIRRGGTENLIRTFFAELLGHFDPYSRYVPPEEADADRLRRGDEAGIGADVTVRGGAFIVSHVIEDGPAAQAGISGGDRVIAIDGADAQDIDPSDLADLMSGPEGSSIELRVRGRDGHVRTAVVTRAPIPPNTVFVSRTRDAVILRISSFASDTADRLRRELRRAVTTMRGLHGVVIDLRGNRGGLLRQAVDAADTLVARGLIARTDGRAPEAAHDFHAIGEDVANGLPVIVLVDGRSASSAEILAAALADQGRAVVVGSSTLGKGLVQTVVTLPDDGELFITWSRVLAPSGWPLQGLGVLPQVCTSLGAAQLQDEIRSLRASRAPLASALAARRAATPATPAADVLAIRSACPAAEGGDSDMMAVRFLLDNKAAYAAALLTPAGDQGGN